MKKAVGSPPTAEDDKDKDPKPQRPIQEVKFMSDNITGGGADRQGAGLEGLIAGLIRAKRRVAMLEHRTPTDHAGPLPEDMAAAQAFIDDPDPRLDELKADLAVEFERELASIEARLDKVEGVAPRRHHFRVLPGGRS